MRIFTSEVATANALARADGRMRVAAWEDPLTFGRLSATEDLDAFAADRATVYAEAGWDEDGVAEADLCLRNAELRESFASDAETRLVFGGSLLDQLHLAQILAWLSTRPESERARARLMLVDGPLSVFDEGALLEVAREGEPVDGSTLALYRTCWRAVTCPDPQVAAAAWSAAAEAGYSSLAAGLERWLQELPSVENGLSLTQMQTLDAVRLGVGFPQELFKAVQETEAAPFRVNWEFWQVLDGLFSGAEPLLRTAAGEPFLCPPRSLAWLPFHDQRLELTDRGLATLEGKARYAGEGFAPRWLGGVWLDGESAWFWDYGSASVAAGSAASVAAD